MFFSSATSLEIITLTQESSTDRNVRGPDCIWQVDSPCDCWETRKIRRLCPLTDSSFPHVGPCLSSAYICRPSGCSRKPIGWAGDSESRCVRRTAQLQLTSCRLEHFPPGGFLSPQCSGVNLFPCRLHISGRHIMYRNSPAIWARGSAGAGLPWSKGPHPRPCWRFLSDAWSSHHQ